jgi:acetaldehyde dehydrogenase (acetylating)
VGRDYPLSIEKLCPVLSYYEVADWRDGCERCTQILRYGGMGHTMSIHSRNDAIVLEFGLRKPAFRICVNTSTTHGSIGLTTGLDPAMTLGCGGYGGNITSDNISPRHLLNIKRVAYELRPRRSASASGGSGPAMSPLPKAPERPLTEPVPTAAMNAAIERHLRGTPSGTTAPAPLASAPATPEAFVAEDDVRSARRDGRQLLVGPRTIVTPAARDADSGDVLRYLDASRR